MASVVLARSLLLAQSDFCSLILSDLGYNFSRIGLFTSFIGAMGMCLTILAYADLKLSLSAASWAHLWVSGGLSLNDLADLL